jgi:invasion protein IalB
MTKKYKIVLSAFIAAAGMACLFAFSPRAFSDDPPAAAKPAVTAKDYNDWRVACEADPKDAGKKKCDMFQQVMFKDKKHLALAAHVGNQTVKGQKLVNLRLVTPLGTMLPAGIAIKIDDDKQKKLPYSFCLPNGCIINMIFDKDMTARLKAGKEMLVAYKSITNKTLTVKVSLIGFSSALNALTAQEN